MEEKEKNDLFYICSLIEYIARNTKNKKSYIVEKLGKETISKIYSLADIYHTENIAKISSELIESRNIVNGNYDLIQKYENIPSYYDIGKVYKRLIINVANDQKDAYISSLIEVMSSWIIEKIDNYDSSLYYENPSYIYACYEAGKILD